MKQDEITLHLYEDKSIRLEIKEGSQIVTKIISVDTLIDCIKDSLTGVKISTGILPTNVVSVSIDTDSMRKYIVIEFLEERATVTYMDTEYENFPLPRLLFGFRLEGSGRISGVNLGVPALGKLTPDTVMYQYPFSNVNRFSMCTGANSLPHIKTLQQVQNLPNYIISLPDNDDYYKESNNKMKLGHRDLLEHLKDKDRQYYYDHVLVPMQCTSLKDFL